MRPGKKSPAILCKKARRACEKEGGTNEILPSFYLSVWALLLSPGTSLCGDTYQMIVMALWIRGRVRLLFHNWNLV